MLPIMIWLYPARGTGEPLELDFIIWIQIIRCFVTIMSYDKPRDIWMTMSGASLVRRHVGNGGIKAVREAGLNCEQ